MMNEPKRNNPGGATGQRATGQGATDTLAQGATQVKEQVQQAATGLKEQVAEQATSQLADQKSAASEGLNSVAQAFRQTGDTLRDRDQANFAGYIDRAAEQIEQFAGYLGGRDLRELARDAEQFARREPALFLGGAFTLGLFAARFLKSSGQSSSAGNTGSAGDWRGQSEWYGQRQPALPAMSGTAATPPPMPPTPYPGGIPGRGASTGMSGGTSVGRVGGASTGTLDEDVIVGGPPIDDVIVGGPPREPKRGM